PSVITVTASQWKSVLPRHAVLETSLNALDDAVGMVRMMQFLPAPAPYFLKGRSCVIEPTLVEPVPLSTIVGRPCELADAVGKFAEARLALTQRLLAGREYGFSPLAFRYVLSDHIDANDLAFGIHRRMPVCDPNVIRVEFVDALAANLDACNRLAGVHNCLNEFFNLLRHLRNRFADRTANMVSHRNPADLGQTLIDLDVTTVRRQVRKPNRSRIVNQSQVGLMFM